MSSKRALALFISVLLAAACGEDEPREVLPGGSSGSSGSSQDAGSGNSSDGGADGGGSAGDGSGGTTGPTSTTGDGGASSGTSTGEDAGSTGDEADGAVTSPTRDPSTITGIRKPTVKCGDTECEGTTQVCCDGWREDGWATPTCMEKSECNTLGNPPLPFAYPLSRDNGVRSECDGPRDCGSGNADDPIVCCFLLQAPPHYTTEGIRVDGPGLGRECLRRSACLADDIAEAEPSEGMPRGIISCTKDAHCEVAGDGLTCQPEADSDESAGGIGPRAHVSLCK